MTYACPIPCCSRRTSEGTAVSLADLRRIVVVLHVSVASCPDVCPLHADRIAEVQEMVNRTPMKEQVRFVTITTDPVNDTDAVIKDYGSAHGLDPANLTFLTTASDHPRSEEHTFELQSLMRNSYAVFYLKQEILNFYSFVDSLCKCWLN